MRAGGDADAVRHGDRNEQPDTVPDAKALAFRVGQPIGNRHQQCQRDAMPLAVRHNDTFSLAERQPEGLELALGLVTPGLRLPFE